MNLQENIIRIKEMMGLINESDEIEYVSPQFDVEWDEAKRYVDHDNPDKNIGWTKDEWISKSKDGRVVKFSEIEDKIQNTDDPIDFEMLDPDKIVRFTDALSKKKIELPIAVKLPNGSYELIAGNTRLTGLRKHGHDPKLWVFDIN